MPSPNANPINGSELVKFIQGGWTVWLNRNQFAQLLTFSPAYSPRPFLRPTTLTGAEQFEALQDGNRIRMNAADLTTWLAGTAPIPPAPGNQPTQFSGQEMAAAAQAMYRVGLNLADVVTVRSGGGPVTDLSPGIGPTPPVGLTGFYMNGATNAATKAMVSRVKAGTGRGKILVVGDSVSSVGQGTSTDSSPGAYGLVNARKNRPAAVLASLLTNAGTPAVDGSFVGDNGVSVANGTLLSSYDPRVNLGTSSGNQVAWAPSGGGTFAGGNFLLGGNGNNYSTLLVYTPDNAVNTFEVLLYNSVVLTDNSTQDNYKLYMNIDGSAPATGINPMPQDGTGGFNKFTFTTSTAGTHTLNQLAGAQDPNHHPAMCSVTAYNSAVAAIDIKSPGSCGATSGDLASSSAGNSAQRWSRLEYYAYEAPDLLIYDAFYNDMNNGVSVSTAIANAQTVIQAQLARGGNVLWVFPSIAGGNYSANVTAYHPAAKSAAASLGVPFLSLYEYYGPTFTSAIQARTFDGIVHPKAEYSAEQTGLWKQAIDLMVAA